MPGWWRLNNNQPHTGHVHGKFKLIRDFFFFHLVNMQFMRVQNKTVQSLKRHQHCRVKRHNAMNDNR